MHGTCPIGLTKGFANGAHPSTRAGEVTACRLTIIGRVAIAVAIDRAHLLGDRGPGHQRDTANEKGDP
jgi:hypothetical protein